MRAHQNNDAVATWNLGQNGLAPIKLSNQFVVSFDIATLSAFSNWELRLVDESGRYIKVLWGNVHGEDNVLRFLYSDGSSQKVYQYYPSASTNNAMKYYSVTLAFDMDTGTYAYTYDGRSGRSGLKLLGSGDEGMGEFGTVQYITFKSRADDTTDSKTPGNIIIDNMKIYSGTKVLKEVGKQNKFQEPPVFIRPDADPGNYRYCDYDFEDENAPMYDIEYQGGAQLKREKNGNRYFDSVYGSIWSFNFYGMWELSDYIVAEFSLKTNLAATMQIQILDNNGADSFTPISLSASGSITPSYDATIAKLKKGKWVDMAIAINTVDKTYSVWYDDVILIANAKIPKENFDKMGHIRFNLWGGDMATASVGVDNLRVYQGFTPDDYKNTVLLNEPPRDESYLDEMMGEKSPLLDYATEELKIIESAGAVMVNTDTLYIYKDGKRVQGTKAQVDTILKNTSGKKVIKNGLGLVIIGPKSLKLTDEQIASLHDYMIYDRPTAKKLTALFKSTASEHPRVI